MMRPMRRSASSASALLRQSTTAGTRVHALALTPTRAHDQSRALSLQRLSPPSPLLWTPRTPSRHDGTSLSAYTRRLCPTWAVEEGLPSSASGYPCVPASLPRERPAPLRTPGAVCCLHRDLTSSATPPFGFLSHEAAKFTLPHWARRFASLAQGHTALAGLSMLRSECRPLGPHPEPATRRSGAYRGGTCTRKSDAAPRPGCPGSASFRTHHGPILGTTGLPARGLLIRWGLG